MFMGPHLAWNAEVLQAISGLAMASEVASRPFHLALLAHLHFRYWPPLRLSAAGLVTLSCFAGKCSL